MKRKSIYITLLIMALILIFAACNAKEEETTEPTKATESITAEVKEALMVTGESFVLTYTISPQNNGAVEFSSDSDAVTVSQSGRITAVKAGKAKITVKEKNGDKYDVCNITVGDIIVDATLNKGSTPQMNGGEPSGNDDGGASGENGQSEGSDDDGNIQGGSGESSGESEGTTEGDSDDNDGISENGSSESDELSEGGSESSESGSTEDGLSEGEGVTDGGSSSNDGETGEEEGSNGGEGTIESGSGGTSNNETPTGKEIGGENNSDTAQNAPVINVGGTEGETLFATITQAVAAAKVNDTVLIKTGEYSETVSVNKKLTIKGLGTVKIKKIRVERGANLMAENLILSDEVYPAGNDARVYVAEEGILSINNCVLGTETEEQLSGGYAIFAEKQCKGLTIENNTISNFRYGIYVCPTDQTITIKENVFSNLSTGIGVDIRQENSDLNYPTKGEISGNEYNEVETKTQFFHYGEDYEGDLDFEDNESEQSAQPQQPQGMSE